MRKIKSGYARQDRVFFVAENGIILSAYAARTLCRLYEINAEIFTIR